VLRYRDRVIEYEILSEKHTNPVVFILRIPISPTASAELLFEFVCTQFLLQLAFATIINKSQRQILNVVSIVVKELVFSMVSFI
jgi:hypothetical protein